MTRIVQTLATKGTVADPMSPGGTKVDLATETVGLYTVPNFKDSDTADDTTISTTDVLMKQMKIPAPGIGTYLVTFCTTAENSGDNVTTLCLYVGAAAVPETILPINVGAAGKPVPASITTIITITDAAHDIEICWHVSAGTGTVHGRVLTALRIA